MERDAGPVGMRRSLRDFEAKRVGARLGLS